MQLAKGFRGVKWLAYTANDTANDTASTANSTFSS